MFVFYSIGHRLKYIFKILSRPLLSCIHTFAHHNALVTGYWLVFWLEEIPVTVVPSSRLLDGSSVRDDCVMQQAIGGILDGG